MVTLRPAILSDRRHIYDWLANSDLTSSMLGPPMFPENPVPTWEQFVSDYKPHFFDGSMPREGRCNVISVDGEDIGQINYNEIDEQGATEIDIWLASSRYLGKGYGTEALKMLCEVLVREQSCKVFYIAPSARNRRAVRSYEKAGFEITDERPAWFVPDYDDVVVLRKVP